MGETNRQVKEKEPPQTRVVFIRHGEKDSTTGQLTENGRHQIEVLSKKLSNFDFVFSSPSSRTIETAKGLTGKNPETKDEIAYPWASADLSKELNKRATEQQKEFVQVMLEAFNSPNSQENISFSKDINEFKASIIDKAQRLNLFIDNLIQTSPLGSQILIVGHDITGIPAMQLRSDSEIGKNISGFDYLSGFSVVQNGNSEQGNILNLSSVSE